MSYFISVYGQYRIDYDVLQAHEEAAAVREAAGVAGWTKDVSGNLLSPRLGWNCPRPANASARWSCPGQTA
ncbi:hypothetical protein ACFP81_12675 [Deinococcus lacus]|uniref:Uncharacterized protein n=1 Tax=Deinococcus lacus TaxID=392561 RepID=A0ABW1YGT8_9DEIO